MDIKPIETQYKGYRFRSRLEARWAVFFDYLEIKWLYEPEGFELGDGLYYLPDFYLPDLDLWIEVKGVLSSIDEKKIEAFAEAGHEVQLLGKIPDEDEDRCIDLNEFYDSNFSHYFSGGGCDCPYVPCVCPACGKIGFEFDGRGWRICNHFADSTFKLALNAKRSGLSYSEIRTMFGIGPQPEHDDRYYFDGKEWKKMKYPEYAGHRLDDKGYSYDHPLLRSAYRAARQARFEHGEMPFNK